MPNKHYPSRHALSSSRSIFAVTASNIVEIGSCDFHRTDQICCPNPRRCGIPSRNITACPSLYGASRGTCFFSYSWSNLGVDPCVIYDASALHHQVRTFHTAVERFEKKFADPLFSFSRHRKCRNVLAAWTF